MEEEFRKLLEASHLLLQKFGITDYEPIEDDSDIDVEDWAARWGGVEGYSSAFGRFVYVSFTQEVQELLMDMASILHENMEDDYSIEFTFEEDEE